MKKFILKFLSIALIISSLNVYSTSVTAADAEPSVNITATVTSSYAVKVKWTSTDPTAVHTLYRSTKKDSGYSAVISTDESTNTTNYVDNSVKLGKTYYYKMSFTTEEGTLVESNIVSAKPKLNTPKNLKTSITEKGNIKVDWSSVKNADYYKVYRSTSRTGTYTSIAKTTSSVYTDKNATSKLTYYYKVRAFVNNNDTAQSNLSGYVACYRKPAKPSIKVTYNHETDRVKISWNKVSGATKYYVYRKELYGNYEQLVVSTNTYCYNKKIEDSTRYVYSVAAAYTKDGKTIKGAKSSSKKVFTNRVDPSKKMIALTFDDGPGSYTKEIVDCLNKYDSAATFFIVGNRVDTYTSGMKALANSDSEVANHTYSHPTLTYLSASEIRSQVSKTDTKIKNYTGSKAALIRTPGGAVNSTVKNNVGKPIIYWSIDTLDWKTRSTSSTVNSVLSNASDGEIALMHDIHKPTRDAALQLIPKLVSKGYQLVTVSELAKYRGYSLSNGVVYYDFSMNEPKLVSVKPSADGSKAKATIKWKAVKGATYQIVYKKNNGDYKVAKTIEATNTTNSYSLSGLSKNAKYTFKVRQIYYDGSSSVKGPYSSTKTVSTSF